jgi:hypothetical protein
MRGRQIPDHPPLKAIHHIINITIIIKIRLGENVTTSSRYYGLYSNRTKGKSVKDGSLAKFEASITNINFPHEDCAIIDFDAMMVGFYMPKGEKMPKPMPIKWSLVLVNKNMQRWVSDVRGTMYQPSPS